LNAEQLDVRMPPLADAARLDQSVGGCSETVQIEPATRDRPDDASIYSAATLHGVLEAFEHLPADEQAEWVEYLMSEIES
jgi:hypothetical protein